MENYTKLRIIGTGSFGTVWLIRSKEKHRNYVLKEIPLSMFVEERERRFVLNEVQVLSQLRHMNIIRYKEAFLSNGFLCISMEYAHEGDLSDRIRKQSGQMLPKEVGWNISDRETLYPGHIKRACKRDIKCQNILISKENVIKLGDFGIACVLQSTLDHAQTVIGTPYNLSPEICQQQPYNHKSDIWALGCVLYEMITLHHPFESSDFPQLVLKILGGDFTPIPENHCTLLQDLVTVLLRVDPSERPSAKQLLHIPAMQPYVNKVLARGRTQRSESVSCSDEGQLGVRKGNVWRKPDVLPSGDECEVEVWDHFEGKLKTVSVGDCGASEISNDVVCGEMSKSQRKRHSSEVFSVQDDRLADEIAIKKMKVGQGKENHDPAQRRRSKHRSYSTSIVRESAEPSPLAPLSKQQTRLRGTYDVIPDQKQVIQDTYTKRSSCRSRFNDETSRRNYEIPAGKKRHLAKNTFKINPGNLSSQKTTEFLKVLLGGSQMVFKGISPESSLRDYVQAMKWTLEKGLGLEMFNALNKYLRSGVDKDLSCGVNICETMFEALGDEGIVFVPLMLQFIQCETNLAT